MYHIPNVTELEEKAGYHIMRYERMPSWLVVPPPEEVILTALHVYREAHDNMNGGHWSMTCSKVNTVSGCLNK